MAVLVGSPDAPATYARLRAAQRALTLAIFETVSTEWIQECARLLGMWQGGQLVFRSAREPDLLADYVVYECRHRESAVERYWARGLVPEGTDEHIILGAMRRSRFTLVELGPPRPEGGACALDRIYGRELTVLDVCAVAGGPRQVLAARLLDMGEIAITTGVVLPFDAELADMFVDELSRRPSRVLSLDGLSAFDRMQLARHLLALAGADARLVKQTWRPRLGKRRQYVAKSHSRRRSLVRRRRLSHGNPA